VCATSFAKTVINKRVTPSGSTTEELGSNTYFAIAGVLVALVGRVQQHSTWASVTGVDPCKVHDQQQWPGSNGTVSAATDRNP
jgi:hypothetical protein